MKKLSLSRFAGAVLLVVSVSMSLAGSVHAAARMPEFVLKSAVDGVDVESSSFSGKVLLVSFFATWCMPCIEEVPTFIELQTNYAGEGFSIVALSVDQGGPADVVRLINKRKINYPVLMADEKTMENFGGVYGIPVSFLINMEGNVVKKYPGYVPKSILQKDITSILDPRT